MNEIVLENASPVASRGLKAVEGPGLGAWILPMVLAGSAVWIALIVMLMR